MLPWIRWRIRGIFGLAATVARRNRCAVANAKTDFLLVELMALNQACVSSQVSARNRQLLGAIKHSGPTVPYREAHVMAEIRKRQQRGESLSVIARGLNRDGLRGAYGGRWYAASVHAFIARRSQER